MSALWDLLVPRAASDPWTDERLWSGGGLAALLGRKTQSGERVTETTASGLSTYTACLDGISADVAKVPASEIERLIPRGRKQVDDSPLTTFFSEEFNPECAAFTGRETLTAWALGWGGGFAEIERDGRGNALALWLLHPSRMAPKRRSDGVFGWLVRYDDLSGRPPVWISDADVFHVHGRGDGVMGVSILQSGAEVIGLGLAAQKFGASLFSNDLTLGLVITPEAPLSDDALAGYRAGLLEAFQGAQKAHSPLIGTHPTKVQRTAIPPEEAQMLESRSFNVEEVCRLFRRHPRKVGHQGAAAGWATLSAYQSDDVSDCLMPWWVRFEQEAKRKLLRGQKNRCLKFFVQGLMRGDAVQRVEYLSKRVAGGTMTPNEAREIEDENPSDEPQADRLLVQGATVLLGSLSDDPPENDPAPPRGAPVDDPPADPKPAKPADEPYAIDLGPVFLDAAARVVAKEVNHLERATKKHEKDAGAFRSWAEEFYAGQREFVASAFASVALVLGAQTQLLKFADALWPDPVARTGEAMRVKEEDLAAALAVAARAATKPTKEIA